MTNGREALEETGPLTPERYAEFIGQIEFRDIWLQGARLANHHGPSAPERVAITVDSQASFDPLPAGFRVTHTYLLRAANKQTDLLEIDATFALDFDSQAPMTGPIFELFSEINLPVNSWPYLREYVSTAVARMGWLPVTLPAIKRGTRLPATSNEPPKPARKRRTRNRPNDTTVLE
jgi:hypothetical protein